MSGLSRMPETPKSEDVLNQWEFSEWWKKLVKKEDANYISEWTAKEVAWEIASMPKTPEWKKEEANKVLDSSETKSVMDMLEELVGVFKNDKEWKFNDLRGRYKEITWNVMNLYHSSIEEQINKDNKKVENKEDDGKNVQYMPDSPEARTALAEGILSREPANSDEVINEMEDVFENWTVEHKQIIYWVINSKEFSEPVKELYDKVESRKKPNIINLDFSKEDVDVSKKAA